MHYRTRDAAVSLTEALAAPRRRLLVNLLEHLVSLEASAPTTPRELLDLVRNIPDPTNPEADPNAA